VGHLRPVLQQLLVALKERRTSLQIESSYRTSLQATIEKNKTAVAKRLNDDRVPLGYHYTFKIIHELLPKETIIISEGANTMDISRSIFTMHEPRMRMDAATSGTMGAALGYGIAAQLLYPDRRVAVIVGDSSFGFSAMELETAARHKLPLIVIVINNNGIYAGLTADAYAALETPLALPACTLLPEARYEKMAEAFHGRGFLCRTGAEVTAAVREALAYRDGISVLNILIDSGDPSKQLVSQTSVAYIR
jgi:2-hydroxyacyl-CoA lyase 1